MDNAAKALIIAGGILLAILIISLGIYIWQLGGNFINQGERQKEEEQIREFNQEYESYQRQALRGTDVISIINKVRNNNIKNAEIDELQITWEVNLKQDLTDANNQIILKKGKHTEETSGSKITAMLADKETVKNFKTLYFRCSNLLYNEKTGKVNKIIFEEYLSSEIFN